MNWQRDFIKWHVATEHPWDFSLHMEAMTLSVLGFSRAISEEFLPVIEEFLASVSSILARTPEEA